MKKVAILILSLSFVAMAVLGGCTDKPRAAVPLSVAPGVYEFDVGNSLYPKSRGASIGFQRYFTSGEEVRGSLEWKGNDSIHYRWSLYAYGPDGSAILSWDGADLRHDFTFVTTAPGIYKVEILKRDFSSRHVRLTINPPDWNRWGKTQNSPSGRLASYMARGAITGAS